MLFTLLLLSCSKSSPVIVGGIRSEIPLYRSTERGERLFVAIDLPTVGKQYFMIDSGAAVSAIRGDLVNSMQLTVEQKAGYLTGVSGRTPWIETIVPEVQLGTYDLGKVAFAVGVEGLPTKAGLVPIAGVLGNNVWEQFILDIDYGAEVLRLHPEYTFSEKVASIDYDGQHILSTIELWYGENQVQSLIANIDTGSSGLILNDQHVPQLKSIAQKSREAILGVGSERSSQQDYVVETQMVEVQQTKVGGQLINVPQQAILLTPYDPSFKSLVGYQLLENHRLVVDYANEQMELTPSKIDLPPRNLHEDYLQSILWGAVEADPMTIIELHFFLEQESTGLRKLKRLAEKDDDPKYRIGLANYHFQKGDLNKAIAHLETLDPEELIKTGTLQSLLLAYLYSNQADKADVWLEKLQLETPSNGNVWWLKSMLHLLAGDITKAKQNLYTSLQYLPPQEFLIHQALLKWKSEDISGTVALMRKDIQYHPLGNHSLWFLTQITKGTPYESLTSETINELKHLEFSRQGSLDFLSAALWEIGETKEAKRIAQKGKDRDCLGWEGDSKINCLAWYDALTHQELPKNIELMTEVVKENPGRSDYIDTLAVLYRANGEHKVAQELSKRAMVFAGSDGYMIWQYFVSTE